MPPVSTTSTLVTIPRRGHYHQRHLTDREAEAREHAGGGAGIHTWAGPPSVRTPPCAQCGPAQASAGIVFKMTAHKVKLSCVSKMHQIMYLNICLLRSRWLGQTLTCTNHIYDAEGGFLHPEPPAQTPISRPWRLALLWSQSGLRRDSRPYCGYEAGCHPTLMDGGSPGCSACWPELPLASPGRCGKAG